MKFVLNLFPQTKQKPFPCDSDPESWSQNQFRICKHIFPYMRSAATFSGVGKLITCQLQCNNFILNPFRKKCEKKMLKRKQPPKPSVLPDRQKAAPRFHDAFQICANFACGSWKTFYQIKMTMYNSLLFLSQRVACTIKNN